MADLKFDLKGLEDELANLDKAISTFEPYSKNFIKNTTESLDGFNSDFISEFKKTLDNMRDTKAPQLVEDLKSFKELVSQVKDAFETTDGKYANYMKGEEKDGVCK